MIHLAMFEVESSVEQRFAHWYEGVHVPRMLARPGWRRMARYRCTDGNPLLSLYELDPSLPLTARLSEAPFRTAAFAGRGIRNYHARTWQEIHAAGTLTWGARWINVVTVDIEPLWAEAFSDWYNDVHVPEILACPGWIANRRYECVDGEPRFLAIYELEDPETPFTSPEWLAAVGWDEHVDHIRGFHGFRVYECIFDSEQA